VAELETSFVTDLKAQSSITAYVGQRVYEGLKAKTAREPYIIVRPGENPRESFTQTDYGGRGRITIYVYTEKVADARTIGTLVLNKYKQFSGTLGAHTVQMVEVSTARTQFGPGNEFRYLVDLVVTYT
jgi:hypothetical protein